MSTIQDFEKLDIRVGKIIEVSDLENGKYSTHILIIDFGPKLGTKKSCARLTNYSHDQLLGRQVLAVTNFPPRQIGKNMSEVLTLGVPTPDGECILIKPEKDAPLGARLF